MQAFSSLDKMAEKWYNRYMKIKPKWTKAVGQNAQGEFGILETQRANFTDRAARDEKYRNLKTLGMRHVTKFTTHDGNNPAIIYVVTWAEPAPLTVVKDSTK